MDDKLKQLLTRALGTAKFASVIEMGDVWMPAKSMRLKCQLEAHRHRRLEPTTKPIFTTSRSTIHLEGGMENGQSVAPRIV